MRFKGLDLNLLVACGAIMETGSVTLAAERLNLTQPAMSSALNRLRAYFDDEIFVPYGRRLVPTPLAETLRPHVLDCLRAADALLGARTGFEPASSNRVFRIAASDYAAVAILSPLIQRLETLAPTTGIEIYTPTDEDVSRLEHGDLDLIIKPEAAQSQTHPIDLLLEERHVVVGWSKNPRLAEPLTEEGFFESPHISVRLGRARSPTFAELQLNLLPRDRNVVVTVQSFLAVPWLLIGTDRLAVLQERLAGMLGAALPVRAVPLPFDMPLMRECMQYHRARSKDDGLRWLRETILTSGVCS